MRSPNSAGAAVGQGSRSREIRRCSQPLDLHRTLQFPEVLAARPFSIYYSRGESQQLALRSNSRGLKGPVNAKDAAGSGPQTLAGSCASAVIIQPWSPLVLQVLQLLEDDLEE